jgi:hypothetical protein
VTERLEQPPELRGPYARAVVVDDDPLPVRKPGRLSGGRKASGCRSCERKGFVRVGEVGDEEDSAGPRMLG